MSRKAKQNGIKLLTDENLLAWKCELSEFLERKIIRLKIFCWPLGIAGGFYYDTRTELPKPLKFLTNFTGLGINPTRKLLEEKYER